MNEAPLWLVTGDKAGDNAQLMVIAEAHMASRILNRRYTTWTWKSQTR
jgi:hypothetical protein